MSHVCLFVGGSQELTRSRESQGSFQSHFQDPFQAASSLLAMGAAAMTGVRWGALIEAPCNLDSEIAHVKARAPKYALVATAALCRDEALRLLARFRINNNRLGPSEYTLVHRRHKTSYHNNSCVRGLAQANSLSLSRTRFLQHPSAYRHPSHELSLFGRPTLQSHHRRNSMLSQTQ